MGGKGKGKKSGKNATQDIPIHQQVAEVLPEPGILRAQSVLVQSEWTVTVCHPQQLTAAGGVSLCPEALVPQIIQQVGSTNLPTAILHSRPAKDLGLVGYPTCRVECRVIPADISEEITVNRYLTQLGFGPAVQLRASGPELALASTQAKIVLSFPSEYWGESISPSLAAGWASEQVPSDTFELLVCRDTSAVFAVLLAEANTLLRASGQSQVFSKYHISEAVTTEVLWTNSTHQEALESAKHALALGLVRRKYNGEITYGLRFRSATDREAWAEAKGIPLPPRLGVFTIQGLPRGTDIIQLAEVLDPQGWQVDELLHADEKGITFAATACGPQSLFHRRSGGHAIPVHIKAKNGIAKDMRAASESTRAAAGANASQTSPQAAQPSHVVDLHQGRRELQRALLARHRATNQAAPPQGTPQPPPAAEVRNTQVPPPPTTPRGQTRAADAPTGQTPEAQRQRVAEQQDA
eukprot:1374860-Amphidinium_carterae.3